MKKECSAGVINIRTPKNVSPPSYSQNKEHTPLTSKYRTQKIIHTSDINRGKQKIQFGQECASNLLHIATTQCHSHEQIYYGNSLHKMHTYLRNCGPGSSVGIATDCGLDAPRSNPGGDEIFRPSRPALGHI